MSVPVGDASPAFDRGGELRLIRLVGDADAVSWVARTLEAAGVAVAPCPDGEPADARLLSSGPVVWVARPAARPDDRPGKSAVDEAVWSFPCLIVVPPGAAVPDGLGGDAPVESFDLVREPEDAPLLAGRLERLLLLHRRRSQTEVVLQNLPDVVYTRTFDGAVTSVNAAGERLFGLRRAEILGRQLASLATFPNGVLTLVDKTNLELLTTGRARNRVTVKDSRGRERVFDQDALLLRDGHGDPSGVQVILSDMTEEHEFQERLRREAERNEILAGVASGARDSLDLRRILGEATRVLGSRLDARTVDIWFLNPEGTACTMFHQWRCSEDVPSLVGFERVLSRSPVFTALIQSRQPYIMNDRLALDPDSTAVREATRLGVRSIAGVPIHREGEMIGALGITWGEPRNFAPDDIVLFSRIADQIALAVHATRLHGDLEKQLEALAEAQRRQEEAEKARRELSEMLVHDLKNPLAAVTAALELTRDRTASLGDERLSKMLDGSLASARGLQGLIEDALLVYRTEGAPPPSLKPVRPVDALAQALAEGRWLASARRIALQIDVPPDLPPVPLDAQRFRRAAANLLGNAVKFTPPGGRVSVRAEVIPGPDGGQFVFSVRDSGPGVPEAMRHRIATPYVRLPGTEEIPGTGLGLAVARKVATIHGGRLEVAGTDGPGSVFSLVIPLGARM